MKGYLFRSLIALGCLSSVYISDAYATGNTGMPTPDPASAPIMTSDAVRGLTAIVLNLLNLGEEPELGAMLNVNQAEVGALMDGTTSYVSEPGTGKAGSGTMPLETYSYLHETYLTGNTKTPYLPLNKKLTDSADMEKVVKEMFFLENNADATEEEQEKRRKNRENYLTQIAKEYVKTAYNVQQKLIEDMDVVSSAINGDGSIGATSGTDQTWKAINRALMADIVMQIQLMELDAAKFLSVQPILLMTEEEVAATGGTGTGDTGGTGDAGTGGTGAGGTGGTGGTGAGDTGGTGAGGAGETGSGDDEEGEGA